MTSDFETLSCRGFTPAGAGHGITWRGFSSGWVERGFLWATEAWQCQGDGGSLWLEPVAHISCYYKHLIKSAAFLINNLKISDVAKQTWTETVLFLEVAGNRTSFSWKHYTSRRKEAPLQSLSSPKHCSHSLKQCWPMETHVPMFVETWASQLSQNIPPICHLNKNSSCSSCMWGLKIFGNNLRKKWFRQRKRRAFSDVKEVVHFEC